MVNWTDLQNVLMLAIVASATKAPGLAPPILDWPTANKQMPWSVILLLGGGFALADACKASDTSASF